MTYPLIVSFYTNDWKYPEYANRMKRDCSALGLECFIQELESQGGWLQNTCLKPQFILDCLLSFKRPVIWLDIDTKIMGRPEKLLGFDRDFAGCKTPKSHMKDLYVSMLAFSYNEKALGFIRRWISVTGAISDHSSFDETWKEIGGTLDSLMLPSEYSDVMYPNSRPKAGSVFAIELSTSESKRQQMAELRKIRGY